MDAWIIRGLVSLKDDASTVLDKVQGKFKDTSSEVGTSTSRLGTMLGKIGPAIAGAFAVKKVAEFGKEIVVAAAQTKAIQAQFDQVFEGINDTAESSLKAVASEIGAVPSRIKPAFNAIGAFAKVAGMDTAQGLAFAERATKAAADTAAFYDKSLEDTTDTLKSYLKGNFSVADNLGILSTETTRNAAATELFGQKYKDLSGIQQQEVLLKMYEDANKVSGALGQAARETDGYENVMGNLKQAWQDFMAIIGGPVLSLVIPILQQLTGVIQWIGTSLQGIDFQKLAAGNPIIQMLQDGFNRLVEWFNTAWPSIQESFMTLWAVIQDVWATVGQPLWTVIEQAIGVVIDFVIANLPKIQEAWSMMVEAISIVWNNILKPVFEVLIDFITNIWEIISENLPLIQEIFDTVFNEIKQIWEGTLKPVFEAIGNFVQNTLKPALENAFNSIRNTIRDAFNAIDRVWTNTLKPVFENIDKFVQNTVKNMSDKFNQAKTTVTSVFDSIGKKIDDVISGAKRVVENGINFIKGLFNFKISWPHIPVPRFGITPSGWSIGDLLKGSIPRLGITWNAEGAIFNRPTIFPTAQGLQGVGEAGQEAIMPINKLPGLLRPYFALKDEVKEKAKTVILKTELYIENFINNTDQDIDELTEKIEFKANERLAAVGGDL